MDLPCNLPEPPCARVRRHLLPSWWSSSSPGRCDQAKTSDLQRGDDDGEEPPKIHRNTSRSNGRTPKTHWKRWFHGFFRGHIMQTWRTDNMMFRCRPENWLFSPHKNGNFDRENQNSIMVAKSPYIKTVCSGKSPFLSGCLGPRHHTVLGWVFERGNQWSLTESRYLYRPELYILYSNDFFSETLVRFGSVTGHCHPLTPNGLENCGVPPLFSSTNP